MCGLLIFQHSRLTRRIRPNVCNLGSQRTLFWVPIRKPRNDANSALIPTHLRASTSQMPKYPNILYPSNGDTYFAVRANQPAFIGTSVLSARFWCFLRFHPSAVHHCGSEGCDGAEGIRAQAEVNRAGQGGIQEDERASFGLDTKEWPYVPDSRLGDFRATTLGCPEYEPSRMLTTRQ